MGREPRRYARRRLTSECDIEARELLLEYETPVIAGFFCVTARAFRDRLGDEFQVQYTALNILRRWEEKGFALKLGHPADKSEPIWLIDNGAGSLDALIDHCKTHGTKNVVLGIKNWFRQEKRKAITLTDKFNLMLKHDVEEDEIGDILHAQPVQPSHQRSLGEPWGTRSSMDGSMGVPDLIEIVDGSLKWDQEGTPFTV